MTMKIKFPLKNQTGAALVIALIIMIALTLIALASSFTSLFEIKVSGNIRGKTDAFYSADGGVQAVLSNSTNFYSSKYTLVPDSSTVPQTLRDEPIDLRFSTPILSLPPGVNYADPPNVTIYHTNETFAPIGLGFSAGGEYEFEYFIIDSIGSDQIDVALLKSNCEVSEKVMRLIPPQGGN